ncbi:hypothetical protein [Segetibacter koreensis]|uniref:hypothetical protein n=1 Tax=Segetibacter koreensis TaxID=398037 RepID=UPI00146BBF47|nr:hypothetical protein [Segetibacter koreensis]
MGVFSVRAGRWKSNGGGTCLCVADPGRAQFGTSTFELVVCAASRCDRAQNTVEISRMNKPCFWRGYNYKNYYSS